MGKNLTYALKADAIDRRTSIKAVGESIWEAKKWIAMGLPMLLLSCKLDVKKNPLVTKFFEEDIFEEGVFEKSIEEGYQYNQDMFTSSPTAILKTQKGRLDSSLWNCEIKDALTMQKRVKYMKNNAQQEDARVYGANILYKGKMLGEVYGFDSYLKSNPRIWLKKGNKFTIETPGMKSAGGGDSTGSSGASSGGGAGAGGGGGTGGSI